MTICVGLGDRRASIDARIGDPIDGVEEFGRDDRAEDTGQAVARPIDGHFGDTEGRLASGAAQAPVCLAFVMWAISAAV